MEDSKAGGAISSAGRRLGRDLPGPPAAQQDAAGRCAAGFCSCKMGQIRVQRPQWTHCSRSTFGKSKPVLSRTMAMALFTPESMFICNLGDSRVYFSDGEQFHQLSTDHVLGRSLIGKAPLTQYLGMPEEQQVLEPFVTEIEHKEGYRYLLCSDGVTDMLSDQEIREILSQNNSLSETVQNLLEQALQKGGRDNVTIVLCEVQKQESGRRLRTWLKGLKDKNEG